MRRTIVLGLILAALVVPATAKDLAVEFVGTATLMTPEEVLALADRFPNLPADVRAIMLGPDTLCFEVPMNSAETGLFLGTGLDCLFNIEADPSGIVTLEAISAFRFRFSGTIWARGDTTVAPLLAPHSAGATHATGGWTTDPNVFLTTGEFSNYIGNTRLSGLVDLTAFPGQMGFRCMWQIHLAE